MGAALAKGFSEPVFEAQHAFRAVMNALARPGTIATLSTDLDPPAPLTPELAAIALALVDHETPLWLDAPLVAAAGVAEFLRFHTGAAIVAAPDEAAFALVSDPSDCPPLDDFALGAQDYPDRSTTLVIAVDRLAADDGFHLAGPGILDRARLALEPLPPGFAAQLAANRARFPRGVDLIFACAGRVAALPRTTVILEGA